MGDLVPDSARLSDVIVAPATPPGVSALAVVRLTGPPGETLRLARRLAPGLPERPVPRRVTRCELLDADGRTLDDALVLFFEAPRSATGEEVVELFCHGSPAIVSGLLSAARRAGARPAGPGEFTRRALANGKLDLAEAEGVARLAEAESAGGARRALSLVRGELSRRVEALREALLDELSELEAGFDFSDDVAMPGAGLSQRRLAGVSDELLRLMDSARDASRERVPVVAIVGRPNAGKSTLFNALVGQDRAIVTAIAGTTRDAISETVEMDGERVRLVDTAGLRATEDEIEKAGVDVARRAASGADLLLYAVDPGDGITRAEEDHPVLAEHGARKKLLVFTKADQRPAPAGSAAAGSTGEGLEVSALTGRGMERLRAEITRRLTLVPIEGELLVLERHREAFERTRREVVSAADLLREGAEARGEADAYVASALRRALSALGEITGETATEDLLDRIFSRFCLGK